MLPGKKLTPEDLWRIVRRRFWLIVLPFAVVSAATAVYVRYLPDVYQSVALIAVEPPRVPADIVRPTMPMDIEERLPAIRNEILSRTRLERIIEDLNLYPAERRTGIMEDIVERMRGEVLIAAVRGNAIRVGFEGGNPREVQRVAERLAALFIDESSRDRAVLIEGTDQFLETSLEEARQRLAEKEAALARYRLEHSTELPEQTQANVQQAQTLSLRAQQLVAAIDREQERRLLLERQLAELESQVQAPEVVLPGSAGQPQSTAQQLAGARLQLTDMEVTRKLKADHPDVRRMRQIITGLEEQLDREAREAPLSAGGGRAVSPAEATRQRQIAEVRNQIQQIDLQTQRNREEATKLQTAAAEYQRRAEAGPIRQTEMVELNRDYNTVNGMYTELLRKREESNLSANLERRQIGEQFQLLDQARVPARPSSPNRTRMNLMGMGAGLAVGLLVVGFLEYRDSTIRTDDELTRVLGMPVLAVVPLMQSEQERRQSVRRKVFVTGLLGSTVLGCLAVLTYTFVR